MIRENRMLSQETAILAVIGALGESNKLKAIDAAFSSFEYLVPATMRTRFDNIPDGVDKDDLLQDGKLALVNSLSNFDPNKRKFGDGMEPADILRRFRTYAISSISNRLLSSVMEQSWSNVGRHNEWRLNKVISELRHLNHHEPSIQEIADVLELDPDDVSSMLAVIALNNPAYMSDSVGEGSCSNGTAGANRSLTLEDVIPDPNANVSNSVIIKSCNDAIKQALATVPENWKIALLMHYRGDSYEDIAEALDINEQRVGQIIIDVRNSVRTWFVNHNLSDLIPDWVAHKDPQPASHREGRKRRREEKLRLELEAAAAA